MKLTLTSLLLGVCMLSGCQLTSSDTPEPNLPTKSDGISSVYAQRLHAKFVTVAHLEPVTFRSIRGDLTTSEFGDTCRISRHGYLTLGEPINPEQTLVVYTISGYEQTQLFGYDCPNQTLFPIENETWDAIVRQHQNDTEESEEEAAALGILRQQVERALADE